MPLSTLEERIAEFERQTERLTWSGAVLDGLLSDASRRLIAQLEATHATYIAAHRCEISAAIERVASSVGGGRRELIRALNREMTGTTERLLVVWAAEQERLVESEVQALLCRLESQIEGIVAEVSRLVEELFHTRMVPFLGVAPFSVGPPSAHVDAAFSLMLEELPLLLPGPIARRMIRERFLRAAPEELTRNLARVTASFRQQLSDAQRLYRFELEGRVETMLRSLREALHRCRDERAHVESDARARGDEAGHYTARLDALREQLATAAS